MSQRLNDSVKETKPTIKVVAEKFVKSISESIHRKGQTAELIDEKTEKFNDSKLNIKNGSKSSNVNESEHLTIDNENTK